MAANANGEPAAAFTLLQHDPDSPSLFTPESLLAAVRAERPRAHAPVPAVCVLDFDGDLTDALVAAGRATPCRAWACFHTTLYEVGVDGEVCGLIPRTIGGPYAVLVSEQLAASGAGVVLGLTSSGRVVEELPVPSVVVASAALRDEGTSFHYLPPADRVTADRTVAAALEKAVRETGLPVRQGLVWTTDAPYRETAEALRRSRAEGALAVEMQAASLFAFGAARGFPVGLAAHVTNVVGGGDDGFDKGPEDADLRLFEALCRAGLRVVGDRS
ncbi:MAG: nucleoside phosphorylase [Armatimonadetes bacterium]|nr:nucleoside phosphorylase [Armatimonadota bacterium]